MKNLELRNLVRHSLRYYKDVIRSVFADNYLCVVKIHSECGDCCDILVYDVKNSETGGVFEVSKVDKLLQCEYLPFNKRIWIGTRKEFILIEPVNREVKRIDHYVQSGNKESLISLGDIENAKWDPTGTFILVTRSDGTFSIFIFDFTNGILEELQTSSLKDVQHKTEQLNWGSAERQFRTQNEQLLIKVFKDEQPVQENTSITNISWRLNGDNLIVNYRDGDKRKLKVYNDMWKVIHESADIPGLQSVIAWKGYSLVFAGVVCTSKRTQLVIFEKNCEIKNRYDLEMKAPVVQLKWNDTGEVLAIHQKSCEGNFDSIDLYVFKNSTMYLKQRLLYLTDNHLVDFEFLKSDPHLFEMRTVTEKEVVTYFYKFASNCSVVLEEKPHTICAVIQGCSVLLTYCKNGMCPPPYYDLRISLENPANFVFFHPNKPLIGLVDCYQNLAIYNVKEMEATKKECVNLHVGPFSVLPLKYYHFLWVNDTRIYYIEEPEIKGDVKVHSLSIKDSEINDILVTDKSVNYMGTIINSTSILHQINNDIIQISNNRTTEKLFTLDSIPINIRSIVIEDQTYVFSLMSNGSFFVNQTEVVYDVISFIVYDNYMFWTTLLGTLMGIRLSKENLSQLINKNLGNFYVRQIEQGSYLICGIPSTPYIASQMPRGNIELYSCKLIVVDTLDLLLENNQWAEAIEFVRSTRLNMNALVDLNFSRFTDNIETFILAAKVPETISDFLLELQHSNIFNVMYNNCITQPEEVPYKVQFICDVMMNYMEYTNYQYYVKALITACFVKNPSSACADALYYIQLLLKDADTKISLMDDAEKAYKIALKFRSSTEMYRTALLTYDLNLIMFTAMNSGIEPSEFIPFLRELENADKQQRCFKIHHFLKEYKDALFYLIDYSTDDDAIFDYINKYQLFEDAQWLIHPEHTALYSKVMRVVADNLSNQNKSEEAAIYFKRIGDNKEALKEYVKALCWTEAISIMKDLKMSGQETFQVLRKLAEGLKSTNRIVEAAKIYNKHLHDYEAAIMLCIEHRVFDYAIKLALKYNRLDIYENDITEAMFDYCTQLKEKFVDMLRDFIAKKDRLSDVREEKKCQNAKDYMMVSEVPDDLQDQVSLAPSSTLASLKSSSSRKTARSRRKQERKKHSMREGSIFEDIALMEALYNLVHEAFDWGPKVRDLCLTLMKLPHISFIHDDAKQTYFTLRKLLLIMESGFLEIWPPLLSSISVAHSEALGYENISQMDMKYRTPPNNIKLKWELTSFSSLNNLYNNHE